ncbi:serine protease [Nesidiocoris tenuis]|uniref:Serine protease n=1 Tax=Nesidiocoris tenuis TaxID=355587 RepID=A0ABN7A9L4_9HEMI|nr:serine protease [Nesidiocoris tenuis]
MKGTIHVFLALLTIISEGALLRDDCVDSKRTLRCVLPASCPSQQFPKKNCPTGKVCCSKNRPNLYLPLRADPDIDLTLKGRALQDAENAYKSTTEKIYKNEDKITFPNDDDEPEFEEHSFRIGNDRALTKFEESQLYETDSNRESETPLRKSEKYCREYERLTIDVGYASLLLAKLVTVRYEIQNCKPPVADLIYGGSNVSILEFPHMVALAYNRSNEVEYLCGGSLISDEFILTAAHCIRTKWGPPLFVYMGATQLHSKKGQIFYVDETYPHYGYRPPSCYNDIALIRLTKKVKLTPQLRPACLPTEETIAQYPNNIVVATGWGRTASGEPARNLQKVALKIMDTERCGDYYTDEAATPVLRNGITSDLICAVGKTDTNQDTCQGDSGGPLQAYLPRNRCMSQVLGITSFGKVCGTGVPGVYTKVSPYLTWIENIVWP